MNPCELHWKNSYVIDPDGGVYKGPAVAGRPEMAVAHVNGTGADLPARLTKSRPWESARRLRISARLSWRMFGSEYLKTVQTGRVHCRKPEIEASFREKITRQ